MKLIIVMLALVAAVAAGNAAIGEWSTAAGVAGWAMIAFGVRWAWSRMPPIARLRAREQGDPALAPPPRSCRPAAPGDQQRERSELEQIRSIRLWLRDIGREDAALSDSDIRALAECIMHLCRHGRITSQALGGGRMRITVDTMETGGLRR